MTQSEWSRRIEAKFRKLMAEQGGVILDDCGPGEWYLIRCAVGHELKVHSGQVGYRAEICRVCVPNIATARSKRDFYERLSGAGVTLLESGWLGAYTPHRGRCAVGHETTFTPSSVGSGHGCRVCAGMVWDDFYVVHDPESRRLKFGITSGDPRSRLGHHRRDGFTVTVRLFVGLPGETAPQMERDVLAALQRAGERPVRGREYYADHVVPLVLEIVDSYPRLARADCPS